MPNRPLRCGFNSRPLHHFQINSPVPRLGHRSPFRQTCSGWVRANTGDSTISITLETGWNSPLMSVEGYSKVGAGLGRALAAYLIENPRRE